MLPTQSTIAPIGAVQQNQVLAETRRFIGLAEQIYQRSFPEVEVCFDLSGSTAGMYKVLGPQRWIRYNPWIFSKYFSENLSGTVPHEVAHFVVDQLYSRRGIKPHGPQWQEVMAQFEADPGVTFKLDLSGIPQRRQQRHRYHCDCRVHEVSTTRHRRVERGTGVYHCVACHSVLRYQG